MHDFFLLANEARGEVEKDRVMWRATLHRDSVTGGENDTSGRKLDACYYCGQLC